MSRAVDRVASHRTGRVPILVLAEVGFSGVSVASAAAFLHSGEFWRWSSLTWRTALIIAAIQLIVGALSRAFGVRWRFVGIRDALVIVRSGAVSGVIALGVVRLFGESEFALRFVAAATAVYVLSASGARL
ncbi:MAG: hypothetical protein ABSB58_12775, partial [Gemmatimonadales bacterium]